jgi:hypothetical protein
MADSLELVLRLKEAPTRSHVQIPLPLRKKAHLETCWKKFQEAGFLTLSYQ